MGEVKRPELRPEVLAEIGVLELTGFDGRPVYVRRMRSRRW